MSTQLNSKLAYEISTVTVPTNYAGLATNALRIQALMDLLSAETVSGATDQQARLFLDEMTPICRVSLLAHMTKLKAALVEAA